MYLIAIDYNTLCYLKIIILLHLDNQLYDVSTSHINAVDLCKVLLNSKKVGAWCCDCFLTNALIAYFDETFRQRLYTITPWLILQVYFPPSWTDKQQRKLLEKPKRDAKAQNSEEGRSQDTEPRSRSSVFLWLNRVSGVPKSRCKKDHMFMDISKNCTPLCRKEVFQVQNDAKLIFAENLWNSIVAKLPTS